MRIQRLKMITSTRTCSLPPRVGVRTIRDGDAPMLGALMYHAYHGSHDDENETLVSAEQEMRATLGGRYGRMIGEASFAIVEGATALGATIVVDDPDDGALLAFCMTHPMAQGQGVGSHLVRASMDALHRAGIEEFALYVAQANVGAIRLYERLGFTFTAPVVTRKGEVMEATAYKGREATESAVALS